MHLVLEAIPFVCLVKLPFDTTFPIQVRSNSAFEAPIHRRQWLQAALGGAVAATGSGWLPALADSVGRSQQRKRSIILLWMPGGPSQLDTFDPKPEHANGGPFKPISTSVPGMQICEHLPKLSQWAKELAIVRSMSTKEGDHGRATYLMRTGQLPQGPIEYPTLGSLIGKEMKQQAGDLPSYVSVAPYRFLSPKAFGPGFLGPQYAPLEVGSGGYANGNSMQVRNLKPAQGVTESQARTRLGLLQEFETSFQRSHPDASVASHRAAYRQAIRMMDGQASESFNLSKEPSALRDSYGRNQFGQGCLLARRLIERGVPFVEVSLFRVPNAQVFGWDTHTQNFPATRRLCEVLDPAWATLMHDLKQRGLLEDTMVVWAGEFGRTPRINGVVGRDHYPAAWSAVLAGGGIRGGQVIGETTPDGMRVKDRKVSVPDFLSTVCHGLGVDPRKQNMSNVGRPIRLVDPTAQPSKEALA